MAGRLRGWSVAGMLGFALVLSIQGTSVYAFDLGVHKQIVEDALSDKMSPDSLAYVIGDYVLGTGNLGNDRIERQWENERHFDNARNPNDICDRWNTGLNTYLEQAVKDAAPDGPDFVLIPKAIAALGEFGHATHSIEDFYSHTNWLELSLAKNATPGMAPLTGPTCNPADFPADLQSGYFSMDHLVPSLTVGGVQVPGTEAGKGCPPDGPPEGFKYCHSQINKDDNTDHGACPITVTDVISCQGESDIDTYHTLAVKLATQATIDLWERFHQRVKETYNRNSSINGECVFQNLAWRLTPKADKACLDLNGTWKSDAVVDASGGDYGGLSTGSYQVTQTGDAMFFASGDTITVQSTSPVNCHYSGQGAPFVYQGSLQRAGQTHNVNFSGSSWLCWAPNDKGSPPCGGPDDPACTCSRGAGNPASIRARGTTDGPSNTVSFTIPSGTFGNGCIFENDDEPETLTRVPESGP